MEIMKRALVTSALQIVDMMVFLLFLLFARTTTGACPSGFYAHPGRQSCLSVFQRAVSWYDAREQCAVVGSHLASPDSASLVSDMTDFMQKNFPSLGHFWMSYNDIWQESDYRRSNDGTAVTYFNWYTCCNSVVQPNDPGNSQNCILQDVVSFSSRTPQSGGWQDKECGTFSSYPACEMYPDQRTRGKRFVRVDSSHYNLDVIQTLTPPSAMHCAQACTANLLCDAIAVMTSYPNSDSCKLLTLKEQTISGTDWLNQNQMTNFVIYLAS